MNIPPLRTVEPRAVPFWRVACARPLLACIVALGVAAGAGFGQEAGEGKKASPPQDLPPLASLSGAALEAAVTAARERAKLLHDVYASTLEAMHRHYFRRDGSVLPARAMEDVFEQMAGLSGGTANWISVNTKAMSINHEPATVFEKKAAEELAAGKEAYELVGKRVYRRAASIPLGSSCVGCHTKMFSEAPKTPRFAGLVISIPLKAEKK